MHLLNKKSKNKGFIFTFWEPKDQIPGYLKLCMQTWKKFLLDYQIVLLDYKLVEEMIGEPLFNSIICKEMPLAVQADAIRVALLYLYGGIWIDTDVIILNKKLFEKIQNYELVISREEKTKHNFIAFIYAKKGSIIMYEWLIKIIDNVRIYKNYFINNKYTKLNKKYKKKSKSINYLGNYIIDPLLRKKTDNKFLFLDIEKINVFPERILPPNGTLRYFIQSYLDFYFSNGDIKSIIKNTKGLIFLHNSWTPKKYKNMSEKEFLKQDILLSKLLAKIIDIKII